ncbi:peptide/nickel transport system substrate-binding protein [Catenulispora sp. MAP12-49]|uniref:ABC transporter substrate-binding protein n=1 Tax=Catenulispora sp. MAP12-49 TaxID=3156302 RepID=UPI003513CE11
MNKRSSAAVVLLLATALGAGACTDPQSGKATAGGTAGGSKVGDTLTIAMQAPATGMNPTDVNGAFLTYTALAYDPLVYVDSKGALQPALASKWDVAPGNTAITFTLQAGATFSDGTPVDADAVKQYLDYARTKSVNQMKALSGISSVDVIDGEHVKVSFSAPDPGLPDLFSQTSAIGEVISPKGLANVAGLTVSAPSAGAGPYTYDPQASLAGDHYTYTANPNYYAKDARQHYKKVVLKVITDPQATVNALRTGQVQVANGDFSTVRTAKAAGLNVAWHSDIWMGLNLIDRGGTVTKALGDVRVRQAINYAINRDALNQATLGEYGVPTDQPAAKGSDGYSVAAATRYTYDPAKAKALLAEAGYADGFDLPVLSVHFSGLDLLTEALVPMLEKVGIHLKCTYVSDAQSYTGGSTGRKYPAVAVGFGSLPMYQMANMLFLPTANLFNGFASTDPALQGMYDDFLTAAPADRTALAVKMEDWLVDNAWFAPVVDAPVFYYSTSAVAGVEVDPATAISSALDWHPAS